MPSPSLPSRDDAHSSAGHVDCETVIRELPDLVDGEIAPDRSAAFERHLAACARCLRKYRFERALLDGLRVRLRRAAVPPGLAERVAGVLALAQVGGGHG